MKKQNFSLALTCSGAGDQEKALATNSSLDLPSANLPDYLLHPPAGSSPFQYTYYTMGVNYISDIHLEHRLESSRAFRKVCPCLELYNGELIEGKPLDAYAEAWAEAEGAKLAKSHNGITLFLGDTASCLNLARAFYKGYMEVLEQKWMEKNCSGTLWFVNYRRQELAHYKTAKDWVLKQKMKRYGSSSSDETVSAYRERRIAELTAEIQEDEELINPILQHYEARDLMAQECFLSESQVFAVLGNHELWGFATLEEMLRVHRTGRFGTQTYPTADACRKAHREMFHNLGIHFLDNSTYKIDDSTFIFGGTGFAGRNPVHNAATGLYRGTVSLEQERAESEAFEAAYQAARAEFRNLPEPPMDTKSMNRRSLKFIVAAHNPISDWKHDPRPDPNVVYFSGHTHKNMAEIDPDAGSAVFAANQVGYHHRGKLSMLQASLYNKKNPFCEYPEGASVISLEQYHQFLDYANVTGKSTKTIQNEYLSLYGYTLYVIKREGYYGFFLIGYNAYICYGGKPIEAGRGNSIQYYDEHFMDVVRQYMDEYSPYRNLQEKVSALVRSFGGSGRIHGGIVDIDFYNHIIISKDCTSAIAYYSPQLGKVQQYSSILSLLDDHNPDLAASYRANPALPQGTSAQILGLPAADLGDTDIASWKPPLEKIDLKTGPYKESRSMGPIQMLLTKRILCCWPW